MASSQKTSLGERHENWHCGYSVFRQIRSDEVRWESMIATARARCTRTTAWFCSKTPRTGHNSPRNCQNYYQTKRNTIVKALVFAVRSFFPLRKKKTKTRFALKGWRLMGKWTRKMPWKLKFTQKCYLLGQQNCWRSKIYCLFPVDIFESRRWYFHRNYFFSADFSEHWNLLGKIWFSFSLAPLFFYGSRRENSRKYVAVWPPY